MPLREIPKPEGPLAKRKTADGHRRLRLNKQEKTDMIEQRRMETLVAMILTTEDDAPTYREIAEELDMSVASMKNLMRTKEFQDVYNDYFIQLGHDPRIQFIQSRIVELLPYVFTQMKTAVTTQETPWTARWQIMQKVLELSGIEKPTNVENDRKEIESFLSNRTGEEDGDIHISIPGKYLEAMGKYKDGEDIVEDIVVDDIIDGDYSDVAEESVEK